MMVRENHYNSRDMVGQVQVCGHGLNDNLLNEPFHFQAGLDHSNIELVRYSDPQCVCFKPKIVMNSVEKIWGPIS